MLPRRLLPITIALGTVGLIWSLPRYRVDKQAALERFVGGSQYRRTAAGLIEYVVAGEGTPVLALHGSGGGYEQGLLFSHLLDPQDYQLIAVSRPGARRTPLESGRSLPDQARLYAALLDDLKIDQVVVMAISAGGISALEFARLYPDRCRGLALISAVGPAQQDEAAPTGMVELLRLMMGADLLLWLMLRFGKRALFDRLGVTDAAVFDDPERMAILDAIISNTFPSSSWRDGVANDIQQLGLMVDEALLRIQVPTLVVHGRQDVIVPYHVAQSTAALIPNAELVTVEKAGHLMVGTHKAQVRTALEAFVKRL